MKSQYIKPKERVFKQIFKGSMLGQSFVKMFVNEMTHITIKVLHHGQSGHIVYLCFMGLWPERRLLALSEQSWRWNMPVDIPLLMPNPSVLPVYPTNIPTQPVQLEYAQHAQWPRVLQTTVHCSRHSSARRETFSTSICLFIVYCIRIVHSLFGTELALWSRRLKRSYYSSLEVCFWIL